MERRYPSVVLRLCFLVALSASDVFAASPSFNSFATNDFTVSGTTVNLNSNRFVPESYKVDKTNGVSYGLTNASVETFTNLTENSVSIRTFGAKLDLFKTTGSMTSNSPTLTAPSGTFSLSDVGKIAHLRAASTNSYDLISGISNFVSSSQVVLSNVALADVTSEVLAFGSNDKAAIQSAINVISSNGIGGTVVIPGQALIAGPLFDPGDPNDHHNALLYLPPVNVSKGPVTIRIRGNNAAANNYDGKTGGGAVLWVAYFHPPGSQTNYARVLDTSDPAVSTSTSTAPNPIPYRARPQKVRIVVEDLLVRVPFDSDMTILDFYSAYNAHARRVYLDGGYGTGGGLGPRDPQSTNMVGIVWPFESSFNEHSGEDIAVGWLYNGMSVSGSDVISQYTAYYCINAITARDVPNTVTIVHPWILECSNAVRLSYSAMYADVFNLHFYNGVKYTNNMNLLHLGPSGSFRGRMTFQWGHDSTFVENNPPSIIGTLTRDALLMQQRLDQPQKYFGDLESASNIVARSVSGSAAKIGSLYGAGPSYAALGSTNGLFGFLFGTAGDSYVMSGAAQPVQIFYNGLGGTLAARLDSISSVVQWSFPVPMTLNRLHLTNAPTFRTTNAAPTSVTVGTTAPDYWYTITNSSGVQTFVPAWINH